VHPPPPSGEAKLCRPKSDRNTRFPLTRPFPSPSLGIEAKTICGTNLTTTAAAERAGERIKRADVVHPASKSKPVGGELGGGGGDNCARGDMAQTRVREGVKKNESQRSFYDLNDML